jgi:hypothetical protein
VNRGVKANIRIGDVSNERFSEMGERMRKHQWILAVVMLVMIVLSLGACSSADKIKILAGDAEKKVKNIAKETSNEVNTKETNESDDYPEWVYRHYELYLIHFAKLNDALKSKNKEAVRKLCSKDMQNNSTDFDADIEKMFSFVKGDIQTWEEDKERKHETFSDDPHIKMENGGYYVYTNQEIYYFEMKDCIKNTVDPDKVGYQLILIVKKADKDKIIDGDIKNNSAGIIIPIHE